MKYVFIAQLDTADILGVFSNIDKAEDFVYEYQQDNQHTCVIYRVQVDHMLSSDSQYIKTIHVIK